MLGARSSPARCRTPAHPTPGWRHLPPEAGLLQAPRANHPGHGAPQREVSAQISRRHRRRRMHRDRRQRPGQALREQQAQMPPRTHVPHHHDPAQALVDQVAHRLIIGHGQHGVAAAVPPGGLGRRSAAPPADRRPGDSRVTHSRRIRPAARAWWRWSGPSANLTPSNCQATRMPA